jgi:uncharacterized membrane protein
MQHDQVPTQPASVLWGQRLQRLVSFRIGCLAAIVALIVAAIASAVWRPLVGPVFFLVFAAVMVLAMFNDRNILYCPYCRKRVKMGATTCHHCGQNVL